MVRRRVLIAQPENNDSILASLLLTPTPEARAPSPEPTMPSAEAEPATNVVRPLSYVEFKVHHPAIAGRWDSGGGLHFNSDVLSSSDRRLVEAQLQEFAQCVLKVFPVAHTVAELSASVTANPIPKPRSARGTRTTPAPRGTSAVAAAPAEKRGGKKQNGERRRRRWGDRRHYTSESSSPSEDLKDDERLAAKSVQTSRPQVTLLDDVISERNVALAAFDATQDNSDDDVALLVS